MKQLKRLLQEKINISDCLATSITIMKYTGVWMSDDVNPWTYKLFSVALVTIFFFLMVFAEFGYIFTVIGDTERIAEAGVLLISHIVQGVKILNIIFRQERIKQVIKFIKGPKFMKTDPVKIAMLEEQLQRTAIVGNIIIASAFVTAILWSVIPVLKSQLDLPLKTAYPFDITKYPFFGIMYAYSAVSLTIFGVNDAAINYIVSALIMMAGAHLDVLKEELVEIDHKGEKYSDKHAVQCIRYHQNIIGYVNEVGNIFGLAIFCQFSATCAVVCMTLYKITITTEPVELMTMIFYINCVFLELLMYCYPGDLIITKSLQVADAAAPRTWTGSLRSRRILLLCMLRSQRALCINAGGVFNASLPTALSVVRAAYSYYAVLQQKINENK